MRNIIIDIETGPADEATIMAMMPEIERGKVPANYKDPAKIAEYEAKIEADYQAQKSNYVERAALSAETGIILAVGYGDFPGQTQHIWNDKGDIAGESRLLSELFAILCDLKLKHGCAKLIGHNLKGFDIPFIIRRVMRLGIMDKNWREFFIDAKNPRYFAPWIVDTMEIWRMGLGQYLYKDGEQSNRMLSSLNYLAKYFGLPEKLGTGDQFAKWFLGGERQKALDYLAQDLMLAGNVALKMGLIDATETDSNEAI